MPRRHLWRRRVLASVLGAAVLATPLLASAHVHASGVAAPACLVCAVAVHGVSDLPVVAMATMPAMRLIGVVADAPAGPSLRCRAACPSRGPPRVAVPTPH